MQLQLKISPSWLVSRAQTAKKQLLMNIYLFFEIWERQEGPCSKELRNKPRDVLSRTNGEEKEKETE